MSVSGSSSSRGGRVKKPTPDPGGAARRCVLVMGMHRSGTSMLTGILNQLGCAVPERLLPANFANERGYFESWAICKLNDEMLQAADSAWDDWSPIPADWFDSPEAAAFQARAATLLDTEYGQAPLLAFKDPRVCRLLPLWRRAFAEKQIDLSVIHIHRNPFEVAASLAKRDTMATGYGLLLWLRYVLEAEAACRDLPRHFISYADLLENWSDVLGGAGKALKITWPNPPGDIAPQVGAFVSPDLRHFTEPSDAAMNRAALPEGLGDTFDILQRWTEGKAATGTDMARLTDMRTQLDRYCPIFAPLLADGMRAMRELAALEEDAAGLEVETEERIARIKSEYETLRHDLELRRAGASALNQQLTDQNSDLQRRFDQAQKDVAQTRAQVDWLRSALEEANRQTEVLRQEKAQLYTSTSWRLMAPSRWLMRKLRR